jgi:hypothetical protein
VKRSFFRLQTGDQFFDAIKHSAVVHSGRYPLVMLDLAVDLNALLTHWLSCLPEKTGQRTISSIE